MLDSIISGVREDLEIRKKQRPKFDFQVDFTREVLDVASALRSNKMNIIAEVKRSSPSKGELASISDPAALASQYEQAGAAVVSVLTESRRFKGSISDFQKVRQTISIPMLRKDFIVDEYQVYESRAIGADLQLLIVAALSKYIRIICFLVLGFLHQFMNILNHFLCNVFRSSFKITFSINSDDGFCIACTQMHPVIIKIYF